MDDRSKILGKIKKCLALSASSNEHEAGAALRQAKKLMEAHNISDIDVKASEAGERRAKAGAKAKPSNWETFLASKIADAFACHVIFTSGYWNRSGEWCFVGCGASPEVAHYAFTVLYRQAKRARDEHVKTNLKRCKTATKTRRADLFSEGWVRSVSRTISTFAGDERQSAAIDAFMAIRYPSLGSLTPRDRNEGRKLRDHEHNDYAAGALSGRSAQLNRGVDGTEQRLALE